MVYPPCTCMPKTRFCHSKLFILSLQTVTPSVTPNPKIARFCPFLAPLDPRSNPQPKSRFFEGPRPSSSRLWYRHSNSHRTSFKHPSFVPQISHLSHVLPLDLPLPTIHHTNASIAHSRPLHPSSGHKKKPQTQTSTTSFFRGWSTHSFHGLRPLTDPQQTFCSPMLIPCKPFPPFPPSDVNQN